MYRHLIIDRKFHIPYTVAANKLLPALLPFLLEKSYRPSDFRAVLDVCRLLLDHIEKMRMREFSTDMGTGSFSGSCSSISSPICQTNNRMLPLISMQQPTMDLDHAQTRNQNIDPSRPRSNSSEIRTGSSSDINGRSWSRNNLLMQRIRASSHCSESPLFNNPVATKSRDSTASFIRVGTSRQWVKTSSNPSFAAHRLSGSNSGSAMPNQTSFSQRSSIPSIGNSRNRSPLSASFANLRRHSGHVPMSGLSNPGLNVPGNAGYLTSSHGELDPRRHSYGCPATSSVNSLITGNVCEGPFITPPGSRRVSGQGSTMRYRHSTQGLLLGPTSSSPKLH
ncbi:hypothetical protein Ciccas_011219, partial [Cichlidogyrus casuarinus]